MKQHILVVDDEPDIRRLVREILEDESYSVSTAKDGASSKEAIAEQEPDLILLDIWMPDIDGITLLKEFVNQYRLRCPVIMMSGHGTVEAAVEATRLGAYDFIEKPLSLTKLLLTVEGALSDQRNNQVQEPQLPDVTPLEPAEIVGKSDITEALKQQLERCAKHKVHALISGQIGSGRALSARYIHTHSEQAEQPFVEFNTAQVMDGSDKNALAMLIGKESNKDLQAGYIEQAGSGTLFIDDVAELSSSLQSALYNVLDSSHYYRVNGDTKLTSYARIIASTRFDLLSLVNEGKFRRDLYHLLMGFPIHVAPLHEHSADVPELIRHFVRVFEGKEGLRYRNFSLAAQNRLRNYSWPGNVMELELLVRRLLIQNDAMEVSTEEIEEALKQNEMESAHNADILPRLPEFNMPLRQAREQFERAYLEFHLKQSDGSVGKVAKMAGLERTHLYRKLRSLGIDTK